MIDAKLKIFAAIAIIVLASGAFWFFLSRDNKSALDQRSTPLDQDLTGQVSEKSADMSEKYTNPEYGFSFSYPKELSVSEFTESGRDIILAKDATGDGFQISITPFDESGPITKERVLQDLPDMAIAGDKIISVGGVSALSFRSKDESGGETRETWFARNGYLYQITAYKDFEKKISQILDTWKF